MKAWHSLKLGALLLLAFTALTATKAAATGHTVEVTEPNGYGVLREVDLEVRTAAGMVKWLREWNGKEWKYNPHWESLSQSWTNLTGSQTADTTSGSGASGGSGGGTSGLLNTSSNESGCWVLVDENWTPSSGMVVVGGNNTPSTMEAVRMTPFNRIMGEATASEYAPPVMVTVDYANLCMGGLSTTQAAVRDLEGLRRTNELYLGESGRYAFDNRSILEKRAVKQIEAQTSAQIDAQLASGKLTYTLQDNPKGYRWTDKAGAWIDYNTQGQVAAWGDRNGNTVWLARDDAGNLRAVIDGAPEAAGRIIYSLHYQGDLLSEVRDYAKDADDIPNRSVQYQYDASNRLTYVIDARGHTIEYGYDDRNHLTSVKDQEQRSETLTYTGDTVRQRIARDGGITDYQFGYDDVNKQFTSKTTGPQTSAGRRTEIVTHNRVGKLQRRTVNGQTEQDIRYDTGARMEYRTNARGYTTRITRNEYEQIVQVDAPDGSRRKRSYSALHLQLTEETDELGYKTEYQYDTRGNLLKQIEAVGTSDERVTDYENTPQGLPLKITRRGRIEVDGGTTPDAVWQYEYNAQGLARKIIDPELKPWNCTYNRLGRIATVTDPRSHTTRYDYDAHGNLTKVTDALTHRRKYDYDKVGNLTLITDARNKIWQRHYDGMNRVKQTTNPVLGSRDLKYDAQGMPTEETDEDGLTNHAEYDAYQRLIRQIDGMNNATAYSYQLADGSSTGQLGALYEPVEIQYPTYTERKRYDQNERPTSQILVNPNRQGVDTLVAGNEYDKRGQLTKETDANDKSRQYAYDALGRLVQITDALTNKTRSRYDARGNLRQLIDAKGNTHQYDYDRNNRLVKETYPLGQTNQYAYDDAGNLQHKTDPNGNRTEYDWDDANRPTDIRQYNRAGTLQRSLHYDWDDANNLTAWTDTDHTRNQSASGTLGWDDANRKSGETVTYPNGASLGYSYGYSLGGRKTRLTLADGSAIEYSYSLHGELQSVTLPGEGIITVSQYQWRAPSQILYPGGTRQNRSHDGLLQLEDLKVANPGQQTILDLSNTWGRVQELKSTIRTELGAGGSSTRSSSYGYDDEIRLTQVQTDSGGLFGSDTETYSLDAVGNRTAHNKTPGDWEYDANHRLKQRGTGSNAATHQYDDAGNRTETQENGQTTRYRYDSQNRLVEVQDGQGNPIARYGYDPLDRRIWKEQYRDRQGQALAPAQRTYTLYADEGLIAEAEQSIALNADGSVSPLGDMTLVSQYGPRPDNPYTTAPLFIKTLDDQGQPTVGYYQHDHLGTPLQVVDKQGKVLWSATYNAYGEATVAQTGQGSIVSRLRFPGQIEDEESGLYYNWHRYYDFREGRYGQRDPIGLLGGVNTYAYVEGNPVSFVDPDGLARRPGIEVLGYKQCNAVEAQQCKAQCGNRGVDTCTVRISRVLMGANENGQREYGNKREMLCSCNDDDSSCPTNNDSLFKKFLKKLTGPGNSGNAGNPDLDDGLGNSPSKRSTGTATGGMPPLPIPVVP